MEKKNRIFKDLLEMPIMIYYMLFKSFLSPMLWGMMLVILIIFAYIIYLK